MSTDPNRDLFIYATSRLVDIISNRGSDIDDILHRIVTVVANENGVGDMELSPLYGVVDTDALQALVSNTATPVEVEFVWEGLRIRVSPDGVAVVGREESDSSHG
ncbi:HalOD1 output domain-containing protein [Halobaculum limi]|uniref:HalOD1 output domain-containing protein n=1 Tax=Halobaculum limi TaxID=3031916 RepID=UPI002AA29ED3|nr:HalOD1 output domain-containing protein [Halobaculum sp. YSMS11]